MNEQVLVANKYLDKITSLGYEYIPKVIGAILVLLIGLWVTKLITKKLRQTLTKSKIDQSLVPFLSSMVAILLKVVIAITVMGMVGIQMTSFVAILGAAGLAVGLALSGTLQNFAGGVIILILKPFKIGDLVEAQGFLGIVKEITIFSTILNTLDHKLVIVPNGPLSTGALVNYSAEPIRRVDWTFGIAYGDDVESFKKAINQFISEDARILKEPASFIGLSELGDSSVNFTVRAWTSGADYWDVFFEMNEKVYTKFSDYGLNIPFPQMDVHVQNNK
ncbi:mechanosensitive ion channel family protein [Flavobacterium crassostreae]|uniref:Mechanosensitive ion channel protein MscS n=1 Tax=Flavobacterium crassostreae TaxID=1763534 RepID=A0A1B9E617_9FLAO|nr:mechanosensitive ion channel domain-containing protein [Flavobacterium crassostreae]OCB77369.1 mechanosensitive ion channel protein MscS [Flavobacterium crassostreae]